MENINKFAPVIIPTLNRYDHFHRLVESLSKSPEAKETELVIGLDYPPSEKYMDGFCKIRDYIPTITGFRKVTVFVAEKNLGPSKNTKILRDYVDKQGYDCSIFTEDDNEFSPNFLAYMNWGLEKYKDNKDVMAVVGYNYPMDMTGYDEPYFFTHEFSSWGYGQWKDKYDFLCENVYNIKFAKKLIFNPYRALKIIFSRGFYLYYALVLCYKNKRVYSDYFFTAYGYVYKKYCLFPTISKVRNLGHDGSGIHCGNIKIEDDVFAAQVIDTNHHCDYQASLDVRINKKISKNINCFLDYNTPGIWKSLKRMIVFLISKKSSLICKRLHL